MKKKPFTKSGIILIDKPEGVSSARVVAIVKRITGARKVGHTGTLDPFATGLMICGINGGTRLSRFFLESDKTYIAGLRLGVETDTMDCTGEISATVSDPVFKEGFADEFRNLLKSFEGAQEQLPPVYSALKQNGVPLYKLARKGTPVQKPPRKIKIYKAELIDTDLPDISFEVACSAGTYIRTLASDLGRKTGYGGHLFSLRRTTSGLFSVDNAVTPDELDLMDDPSSALIPLADALPAMPAHIADERLEKRILNGMSLGPDDGIVAGGAEGRGGFIRILSRKGELISIVSYDKVGERYNYCCVFHN